MHAMQGGSTVTRMTQSPTAEPEQLCTIGTVAKFLAISRSKTYQMMDNGELPYVKLGKSRRIRWSDVCDLVESHRVGGSKC